MPIKRCDRRSRRRAAEDCRAPPRIRFKGGYETFTAAKRWHTRAHHAHRAHHATHTATKQYNCYCFYRPQSVHNSARVPHAQSCRLPRARGCTPTRRRRVVQRSPSRHGVLYTYRVSPCRLSLVSTINHHPTQQSTTPRRAPRSQHARCLVPPKGDQNLKTRSLE